MSYSNCDGATDLNQFANQFEVKFGLGRFLPQHASETDGTHDFLLSGISLL